MDNKICVYAICKNESQFVNRWYESMKEADLVVVLDTGSTDNTVDALEDVGVDIVETKIIDPWRFDVARNESLKLIPDEYNILVCTDLDEVFEPGWAEVLRNSWDENIHERGVYKYIWSHDPNNNPIVEFRYNKIHNRDWIWRTPVHEYLTRKDDEANFYYHIDKVCDLYDKITLHHYPDSNKSRGSYLRLLEMRCEEYEDDDPVSLIYLGREYWFHKECEKAINTLNKVITDKRIYFDNLCIAFTYKLLGYCYGYIAKSDKSNDNFNKAVDSFNQGILVDPEYMENYTGLAELYLSFNNYRLAKKYIELGYIRSRRKNSWMEDGSNWNSIPLEILSISNYMLGNKKDAISYAAKALSFDPDNKSFKDNFETCVSNTSIEELLN